MKIIPEKPEKILVVRYRFIGDTILTVPFLRNLRAFYPDAQIDMLVESISGEVLKYCPYIDNFISYDKIKNKHFHTALRPEKTGFFNYVQYIKKRRYNMAFILKRAFSSALMIYLTGIPIRIGFNTDNRGFLLTHKCEYIKDKHEVDCFLDVLRQVKIPVKDTYLESWTSEDDQLKIDNIMADCTIANGPKILINASASNVNKMWSKEKFANVITELTNKKNAQVFYIGTNTDKKTYKDIQSCLGKELKNIPVGILGKTNVLESLELIKRMDLVIGVDSGILHLATAARVPVIAIFGPMNDTKWKPYSDGNTLITAPLSCRPCDLKNSCKNNLECLNSITAQQVIEAAMNYL